METRVCAPQGQRNPTARVGGTSLFMGGTVGAVKALLKGKLSLKATEGSSGPTATCRRAVPGSTGCRRFQHESVGHKLEPPNSSPAKNSGLLPHNLLPRILSTTIGRHRLKRPRSADFEPHRLFQRLRGSAARLHPAARLPGAIQKAALHARCLEGGSLFRAAFGEPHIAQPFR